MPENKRICLLFSVLFLFGWQVSEMSLTFIINEVIIRFVRDGILAAALILPILAGMGLNFAITIGAICAQIGFLLVLDRQIGGYSGLLLATVTALALAVAAGLLIGWCLNQLRGKEMIATMMIGFIGTALYQLVFMAGFGTVITPHNPEMILSRGVGIRNLVDLAPFRNLVESIWLIDLGPVQLPLFMILLVLFTCALISYLTRTRLGRQMRIVGEDPDKAALLGISPDKIRLLAFLLSTVVASFGQIIFLQNIGMINVYTAHLNSDIFAAAALLAGGATLRRAGIHNVLLGILLFHGLFIVSPQAGQKLFGNAALGEYFRSFVAYGTIAAALLLNIRHAEKQQQPTEKTQP
ncbi:MAG TPA: ABC transporter permease [Patescibacteria group bacterium]|nr:ABC transporter permease [Patescibacteria group bacterium]